MENNLQKQAMTFILFNKSGQVLIQLRDDGNGKIINYPNMWCFPGGGVQKGEEPIDAAVREIKEELDLDVERGECKFLTTYTHDEYIDYVYTIERSLNQKLPLKEGAAIKIVDIGDVKRIPLAFEQEKILKEVEDFIRGFTKV